MGERRRLCLVLAPAGEARDAAGRLLDFRMIYRRLVAPAIERARLRPLRAAGAALHRERLADLVLCDDAVADLTTSDAGVLYGLGVRHAVRPHRLVLMHAEGARPALDPGPIACLAYRLDRSGALADPESEIRRLAELLERSRRAPAEDPFFELVDGQASSEIRRLRTDLFRQQVEYSLGIKEKLSRARRQGSAEQVGQVRAELGDVRAAELGVVVDLMLSFRAVKAWDEMIALSGEVSEHLAQTVLMREQYALALNRAGRGDEAEQVLRDLLRDRGPSSETCGILGRVYKDRWQEARDAGRPESAAVTLRQAIDAYLEGFQTDWRDAYPGINAITLMELCDPPDRRREELLPVVTYAVERRIATGEPDYWDHATRLELAILGRDFRRAKAALDDARGAVREVWEPETTLRNVRIIRGMWQSRGEEVGWVLEIEEALATCSPKTGSVDESSG